MKDFDFDELDKAVSSVLNNQQNSSDQTDENASNQSFQDENDSPQHIQDVQPPEQQFEASSDKSQNEVATAPDSQDQHENAVEETTQGYDANENPSFGDNNEGHNDTGQEDAVSASEAPSGDNGAGVVESESLSHEEANNEPQGEQEIINQPMVPTAEQDNHEEQPLGNQESSATENQTDAESSDQKAAVARPVMPRRRGRFMDVVHPSADMQLAQPKPASQKPSRHGSVVAPSASAADLLGSENQSAKEAVVEPEPEQKPGLDAIRDSSGDHNNEVNSETSEQEQPDNSSQDSAQQREPFLEGAAKSVEKRPLGGYAGEEFSPKEPDTGVASDDSQSSVTPTMAVEEPSLGPEVETTGGTEPDKEPETAEFDHQLPDHVAAASATGQSPFIAKQYKTQEETVDGEEHSVFDTSNYHQPLSEATVSKKKHTITWVLLIVALFVVGAILGALYFMTLN